MRGQPRISGVYRLGAPATRPDPEQVFARLWRWYRDLWVECGTITVRPEELPDDLRARMVAWADETYGNRKGRRHG